MGWRGLVLVAVVSWSVYPVILKAVSARIAWQVSMLLFVGTYAAVTAAYLLVASGRSDLKLLQAESLWPIAAGLLCGIGSVAFFKAVPLVEGSVMMPLIGLYIPLSAIGCLLVLHDPVSFRVIAGIVCAGLAVYFLAR